MLLLHLGFVLLFDKEGVETGIVIGLVFISALSCLNINWLLLNYSLRLDWGCRLLLMLDKFLSKMIALFLQLFVLLFKLAYDLLHLSDFRSLSRSLRCQFVAWFGLCCLGRSSTIAVFFLKLSDPFVVICLSFDDFIFKFVDFLCLSGVSRSRFINLSHALLFLS